ncbi:MAG: lipid-A-disaccharide synthase [Bacteroidales bacterium]|nr:lipid-A-disaccharide synthase [Bacteroidales bacterium]
MKYYIIAGEPSGDLHASNLMRGLYGEDPDAQIRFWGGDLMKGALDEKGVSSDDDFSGLVRHYKDTAVMGAWDVLTHYGKIRKNFKTCYDDLLKNRPDVLIVIDYAGFNLPVAKYAKKNGIRTYYYIVPKTWASLEGRNKKLKAYMDKLYTILPFETDYFGSKGLDVTYCGNPVMDAIENRVGKDESFDDFCTRNGLDKRPKIALVAGSRKGELKYNLPVMLKAIDSFPDYQFVIAGAPSFTYDDYREYIEGNKNVTVVFGETYHLMSHARAALVTSGTATLETAILNCPQVVVYLMWGGWFSNWVAHMFMKVKWISLVNLILGRESVKELFQSAYSFDKMISELKALTSESEERHKMLSDYDELRERVGGPGCSVRAARAMVADLKDTIKK